MSRTCCAASAAAVILCAHANAGLTGYHFTGAVNEVVNASGTTFAGTQIGDLVEVQFLFDPAAPTAMQNGQTFTWEYVIASLSLSIGGVTPTGAPRSIPGTTLWGVTDNARNGNDSSLTLGSFESGEFLLLDVAFDSPNVFVPPADPDTALPPLNLADATVVDSLGHISLPGSGRYITFEVTSITQIPAPGAGVVMLAGLVSVRRRAR